MSAQTHEHRTPITPRSGDTHVIGDDGVAVNVDEQTRAAAEAAAAKAERKPGASRSGAPADAAKAD